MSSKISWLQRGNSFQRVEGEFSSAESLPVGIYNVVFVPMQGFSVERYADQFVFDYKVYGLQNDFIQYVLKTYENTTGNLGILLNGVRGSGKTVSAKIIANLLNLPIIIVKDMGDMNQQLIEYLAGFNFDCVLFFDEFEKNFNSDDSTVLQIMDGVYNIGYRKVFLLTTNSLTVNENLLDRPSRIRYVKQFGNIDLDVVKEYLKDNLQDRSCTDELLDYIDTLKISTIDILKAVVQEVNIHGITKFKKAGSFLNISTAVYEYRTVYGYLNEQEFIRLKEKTKGDIVGLWIEQVERFTNPEPEPIIVNPSVPTEEERKLVKEHALRSRRDFHGIARGYCTRSSTKFRNLKIGDFFNDEKIVNIDYKKNVVMTLVSDEIWFYKISNPDTKPSIYAKDYSSPLDLL